MSKPLVAVVGRPNVGKSTFFNRMAGRRIAIVEDIPGVTRDRLYADTSWRGREFTLIDTGGLDMSSENIIYSQMREQATLAAETADAILFFVDAREGLVPEDREVAEFLRRCGKPVLVAVNKVDHINYDANKFEFYELGLGEIYPISGLQGMGTGDLLDALIEIIPEHDTELEEDVIKIAIVGKPNAGKSSLVNAITGESRVIVSNIPGTTRDAIDTPFEYNGQKYILIDTAGMRRKSKIDDKSLERYSVIRALTAVRRCDVAVVVIDAETGATEQDAKIAGYIDEMGKPSVIAVNKWDLIEKETGTAESFTNDVYNVLSFLQYAPMVFISCLTGQRVNKVFSLVNDVHEKTNFRVSTGVLNEVIQNAVSAVSPPSVSGRRLNIMYTTQASTAPPNFILFVNDEALMKNQYLKYISNYLRRSFELSGTPIKITCRGRGDKKMAKEILFVILLVGGYIIGSLSPAVFLSKKVAGIDIREKGSKNAGSTNVFRVMGPKWGLINFVFDCLKGLIPCLIGLLVARNIGDGYNGYLGATIAGGAVLIGHAFPVFSHFKGGKCVASTTGIMLIINPYMTIAMLVLAVIIIALTNFVSLASVTVFTILPILVWFFDLPLPVKVFTVIFSLLIIILHRANIARLIKGEENKMNFKKKKN